MEAVIISPPLSSMATGKLIQVDPPELRFPFESKKFSLCYVMLTNKTDDHIAYRLRSDDAERYLAQPNGYILLPRSTCKVEVIMRSRRKAPRHPEDITVQSVVTFAGARPDDFTEKWFTDQKADNKVDEVTLQAVCVFPTSIHRSLNLKYTTGKLIEVKPTQIPFPFELKKQIPCSIFISNKTDDHIALKLTSTNWVDYSIRPSMAILLPRSTCEAIVLMEDQRKAPRNMGCNVTFSVYAAVTFAGATVKDIVAHKMFFRESGNTIDTVDLKAIYVSPPKPPSPVPERCDKGSLYGASAKATLLKFCNGLARRRMWKSYTKIKSDSDLIRESLLVSSSAAASVRAASSRAASAVATASARASASSDIAADWDRAAATLTLAAEAWDRAAEDWDHGAKAAASARTDASSGIAASWARAAADWTRTAKAEARVAENWDCLAAVCAGAAEGGARARAAAASAMKL